MTTLRFLGWTIHLIEPLRWSQWDGNASESCRTNQIWARLTNIFPILNIWLQVTAQFPSQCHVFPLSPSLCDSVWHTPHPDERQERDGVPREETRRQSRGVSVWLRPLGSPRFSLGYTNVPRPRVSVTQTQITRAPYLRQMSLSRPTFCLLLMPWFLFGPWH